ncbi:MAG TPA: AIR synthase family protein [Eubacteriales bacterium]|nr:AIR synthase family protein [Clostridia bacterium]HRV72333.1 AIR synthase family protein [Eubacteriales bacterium]
MRIGKLDNDELDRLILSKFKSVRHESLSRPMIGEDCATLDLGGDYAVLSTDPITSASWEHIGRLSVHVNCNDAAAAGADPVGILVTLLIPPDFSEEQVGLIADELAKAAFDANVDVLGGHTEVSDCVNRVVTCTTVIGRASRSAKLQGLCAGCDVVMTKCAALEGSAILASDHASLFKGALSESELETLVSLSDKLSIVPESRIAIQNGALAMHDVTEGGVIGAAWELCYRGGLGMRLDIAAIPILCETTKLCAHIGIDPYRLIGSGSLLIACENGGAMVKALDKHGIGSAVIGRIVESGFTDEHGNTLAPPAADELYKAL